MLQCLLNRRRHGAYLVRVAVRVNRQLFAIPDVPPATPFDGAPNKLPIYQNRTSRQRPDCGYYNLEDDEVTFDTAFGVAIWLLRERG